MASNLKCVLLFEFKHIGI